MYSTQLRFRGIHNLHSLREPALGPAARNIPRSDPGRAQSAPILPWCMFLIGGHLCLYKTKQSKHLMQCGCRPTNSASWLQNSAAIEWMQQELLLKHENFEMFIVFVHSFATNIHKLLMSQASKGTLEIAAMPWGMSANLKREFTKAKFG